MTDYNETYNVFCINFYKYQQLHPELWLNQLSMFFLIKDLKKKILKKCTFQYMCPRCYYRKKNHVRIIIYNNNNYDLIKSLRYYFKYVPEKNIDNIMYKISVSIIKRDFRKYYELLYVKQKDSGHEYYILLKHMTYIVIQLYVIIIF